MYDHFFWLHIKKSAGISTRELLKPHYKEVDRVQRPGCFIQSSKDEWNDILNNYRVPLGVYQFRRSLFAKTFLYPDSWSKTLSFAFSREPTSRCISMFFYCLWGQSVLHRLMKSLKYRRNVLSISYAFDFFLDILSVGWGSNRNDRPIGLHFRTHTNPMWPDVVDENGEILLTRIYRLECLVPAIEQVLSDCGLKGSCSEVTKNINPHKRDLTLTRAQKIKIKNLFAKDYEIYENALIID